MQDPYYGWRVGDRCDADDYHVSGVVKELHDCYGVPYALVRFDDETEAHLGLDHLTPA